MTDANSTAPELIPTRNSLLGRLKDWGDEASWRDFFETYWRLMYVTARRAGLTDAEAQDVVQETVIQVSRRMPRSEYQPEKGSFKSWLLRLTYWRIMDQLRLRQRNAVPLDAERLGDEWERDLPPAAQEFEKLWDAEWHRNLMAAAVERLKAEVNARQFQIFDLCVIQDWPVARVAQTLDIPRAKVYLAKHRVSSRLKRLLKELESQPVPHHSQ